MKPHKAQLKSSNWDLNLNAGKNNQEKRIRKTRTRKNQSVENAGVAFVKGADERNKFFGKNKQSVICDERVRANKAKD